MNIAYLNHQLNEKLVNEKISLEYSPYSLSTMEDAKKILFIKEPVLFLADDQKKAHGRFNRPFYTEKNNGIYFSIRLFAKREKLSSSQLIMAAAIALCETIKLHNPNATPTIKWVNDIFLNRKKVAGILAEGILDNEGNLDHIILGVGINFSIPQNHFPNNLQEKVTSIFSTSSPSPEDFLITFLQQFFIWKSMSTNEIQKKYKGYLFILNKPVTFSYHGEMKLGIPIDINAEGHLIVELNNKKRLLLHSGEISLLTF